MTVEKFILSSDDLELLLLFEQHQDILAISQSIGRDPSGVSRSIKKLAESYPVLEKRSGKWEITSLGRELNNTSRNWIQIQSNLLKNQVRIKIGTNREFLSRVLAPDMARISELLPNTRIDLYSFEEGIENALKTGNIDIGFDCGRPNDPSVAYKMLVKEPIAAYCSKEFAKRYKKEISQELWNQIPHILCERLYPDRIMGLAEKDWQVCMHVNDISSARELAIQTQGWALLPAYTVMREIADGSLVQMTDGLYEEEKYGVWWLRERKQLIPLTEKLCSWMKSIQLS